LQKNADVNVIVESKSPILASIEDNNIRLFEILLDAGADPIRVSENGETAMIAAARFAHASIVRLLLQRQSPALLNARDGNGRTALFIAIQHFNLDIVSILLDSGADATLSGPGGATTLMVCRDVGVATRLLELGVNVNARNNGGVDAMMAACERGSLEIAQLLLDSGAHLFTEDDNGRTSLIHACAKGHTALVNLLLTECAVRARDDLDACLHWLFAMSREGYPALHLAVQRVHAECVRALLRLDHVDVDMLDEDGAPALHYANTAEMVRILLEAGAEELECNNQDTATSYACRVSGNIEILRLLLDRFPDSEREGFPYLIDAAGGGHVEAVRLLLDARPPGYINKQDYKGDTALMVCGDPEMARELLGRGADPRLVDNSGRTALMRKTGTARARVLLEAAPDLFSVRDHHGRTAIAHLCCSNRQYKALEGLFRYSEEHGVDPEVNHRDGDGHTALHFAMFFGCLPTVKLLLEKGADVLDSDSAALMSLFEHSKLLRRLGQHGHKRSDVAWDADVAACLGAVMDAALLRGERV
jgi:ankyrin repeat protein